jgi:hypothetical protein
MPAVVDGDGQLLNNKIFYQNQVLKLTPQVFGLLGMLQDLEYKIRASPLTRVT